jgi:hypothetical protein
MTTQIMRVDASLPAPQNYWSNMQLSDDILASIEDASVKRMLDEYAFKELQVAVLGKAALFANQHERPDVEIHPLIAALGKLSMRFGR